MTPAEHYVVAEKLVHGYMALLASEMTVEPGSVEHMLTAAQVHATLACVDKDTYFEAQQL